MKENFDICTSFHIENGAFLGRLVRLDKVVDDIVSKHNYPKQINSVLADCTSLAVILASSMKYEGLFTLQTQTNGPVSMVVVDVTSDGKVRAYARFDEQRIIRAQELRKVEDGVEPTPYMLGGGVIAFTVDQGKDTQLYQGVVDIKGKTLDEIAMRYFRKSEQLETYIKLFTNQKEDGSWQSGGMMIQKMPQLGGVVGPQDDELASFEEAKILMDSMSKEEMFDEALSSEKLIHRLYHSNDMVVSSTKNYHFECRCSRDKILSTLRQFKPEELDDMFEEGKLSVTCDFCSTTQAFEKGEIITQ